ncbi:uncharacterized protein Tco025E_03805 [Trypanosoma conorhini]|uniref:PH domain-containing protein n=1 Tax=Trypanosoma conorhini TaxID=83891 RepID=A0A3R7L5W1_9TRYP|nr:uncharacterized protein Tco025E_03805 [Trypanosoma conorhini]RNF20349.1 hypothetical protein Tco025E_03805 [Trypanosoma conorhini]
MASSADAPVPLEVSFDILQRVLDEESPLLAQLSYVVAHLHDPIQESCELSPAARQSPPATGSHSGGGSKSAAILRFSQYWELFANISTLHDAHSTLVGKLEAVVRRRAEILEEHQLQRRPPQGTASDTSTDAPSVSSTVCLPAQGTGGAGSIPDLFCSVAMRHFMAEHMMYSLNYSRNIAPCVMKLWRLWRCRCDKQANARLSAWDRQQLDSHMRFLRFLWDAFGNEAGVPSDPRVMCTRLPETDPARLQRRRAAGVATSRSSSGYSKPLAASAVLQEAPPIPPDWRGFETLLVLLATPLSSLRRYLHVARCIIESQCLPAPVRQRLQRDFIDVMTHRLAEEQRLVLDEVARQDVAHIMSLIDQAATTVLFEADRAKPPRIHPYEDGDRTLVHCGRLVKRFRRGRHERLVFLFSDWLCYVEEQAYGRMRLRASISLEALRVVELDDAADVVNGFDIVTKQRRLTFFAPTQEQKQQWVDALRNTAEAHNVRLQQLAASLRHGGARQSHAAEDAARQTRATAPSFSHNSRLRRQQRADLALQQRSTAEPTVLVAAADATPSAAAAVVAIDLTEKPRPNSFDFTHWAQQLADTVHRRVRSSCLLPSSWRLPSPHEANTGEAEAVAFDVDSSGSSKNANAPSTAAADATASASASARVMEVSAPAALLPENPRVLPRTSAPLLFSERFQEGNFSLSCSLDKSNSSFTENLSRNEGREGAESVRSTLLSVIAATKSQRINLAGEDEVVLDFDD